MRSLKARLGRPKSSDRKASRTGASSPGGASYESPVSPASCSPTRTSARARLELHPPIDPPSVEEETPSSRLVTELKTKLRVVSEELTQRDLALQQLSTRLLHLDDVNAALDAENCVLKSQHHKQSNSKDEATDEASSDAVAEPSHAAGASSSPGKSDAAGGSTGSSSSSSRIRLQADSPQFRHVVATSGAEVDAFRDKVARLAALLKTFPGADAAQSEELLLSTAVAAMGSVTDIFSGDLCQGLSLLVSVLREMHVLRRELAMSLDAMLSSCLNDLLAKEVKQTKDAQAAYSRAQYAYELALSRSLALKNKAARSDAQKLVKHRLEVMTARRDFELARCELVRCHQQLQKTLQLKLPSSLCDGLRAFAASCSRFGTFVTGLLPSVQDIGSRIARCRDVLDAEEKQLEKKCAMVMDQLSEEKMLDVVMLGRTNASGSKHSVAAHARTGSTGKEEHAVRDASKQREEVDDIQKQAASDLAARCRARAISVIDYEALERSPSDGEMDDDGSQSSASSDAGAVEDLTGAPACAKVERCPSPPEAGESVTAMPPENPALKQGYLWHLRQKRWRRSWFQIQSGNLYSYSSTPQVWRLLTSTVRECTDPTSRVHRFDVIGSQGHRWQLQAESDRQRDAWVRAIQLTIEEELTAASAKNTAASQKSSVSMQICEEIMAANSTCVDCGDAKPTWASINLGVVMCIQCSGIHRSLGTNVSKVRSLSLDVEIWDESMRDLFKAIGNARFNSLWEARVHEHGAIAPQSSSSRAAKEAWIRTKYCAVSYLAPLPSEKGQAQLGLEESLQAAATEGDALRVLHCIGLGADIHAQNTATGRTALHQAAVAGSLECVELLLLNGAGCTCVDVDELTPLDCAMVASRNEVVAKLLKWCASAPGASRTT